MDLIEYFQNTKGMGILATSDAEGSVDAAIYATPRTIDENTIVLSMLNRLSYANITANPKAAYMFIEDSPGYHGKRLYLTRVCEESDPERIKNLKRKHAKIFPDDKIERHLVYFNVDKIRPLVGDEDKNSD